MITFSMYMFLNILNHTFMRYNELYGAFVQVSDAWKSAIINANYLVLN